MPPVYEYLFSLQPGRELAALQAVIEAIDVLYQAQEQSVASLLDLLQIHSLDKARFQQHDPALIATILDNIEAMLKNDEAVQDLTLRLELYHGRALAATYLGWFGPRAISALPVLVDLATLSAGSAAPAIQAIQRIGNAEDPLISVLYASIIDNDTDTFQQLCYLPVEMGYESRVVASDLIPRAAANSDRDMREAAAYLIGMLSAEAKAHFASVIEKLMNDTDAYVRRAAAEALTDS